MSGGTFREELKRVLDAQLEKPPEQVAREVSDTYPHITLEDAQRITDGLGAVLTARPEDLKKMEREYIDLHKELRKKYRKSGKH